MPYSLLPDALNLAAVLGSGFGAGIGGAFVALLSEEGRSLARALLVQDVVMLGVVLLALVAAQGLPGRAPRAVD